MATCDRDRAPALPALGASFYPEQMDRSLWEPNIRWMAQTGLRVVRLGDFAWDAIEPEQGRHTSAWLRDVLDLLHHHGLSAILCTPTAAPPAWLCERYPDILPVEPDGRVFGFGIRRHTCVSSPTYRQLAAGIAAHLADAFAQHPAVMAWQIDNELGHPHCYCDQCRDAFHAWLAERYGNVEALNEHWQLSFWSQRMQRFDQVPLPLSDEYNPSLQLAYRRFMSEKWIDYYRAQRDALHRHGVTQPITTNMMAPWHGYDHAAMARHTEVVAYDYYPLGHPFGFTFHTLAFFAASYRGLKPGRNVWLMETQTGANHAELPPPGALRFWTLGQVAVGADLVAYFRWDLARGGSERLNEALVHPGGTPMHGLAQVAGAASELQRLRPLFAGTAVPRANVAVLLSYESWWDALGRKSINATVPGFPPEMRQDIAYSSHAMAQHRALSEARRFADVLPIDADLADYKMVVAPALMCVSDELANRLKAYVAAGGTLVTMGMPGMVDEHGRVPDVPPPGHLTDLLGVSLVEWARPHAHMQTALRPTSAADDMPELALGPWLELARPAEGTEVVYHFSEQALMDYGAVTCRKHGNGHAWYLATLLPTDHLARFYRWLLPQVDIPPHVMGDALPDGVHVAVRRGTEHELLCLINDGAAVASVPSPGGFEDARSGEPLPAMIDLEPYDVRVLVRRHGRSQP